MSPQKIFLSQISRVLGELTRKDRCWHNYRKMQELYGAEEYNFMPDTFVLPDEVKRIFFKTLVIWANFVNSEIGILVTRVNDFKFCVDLGLRIQILQICQFPKISNFLKFYSKNS